MNAKPLTKDAYQLMHRGALALAEAEKYGMAVDVPYCVKQIEHTHKRINRLHTRLLEEPEVKEWKRVYGKKFSLSSDTQLAHILYKKLGYKPVKFTAKSEDLTDEFKKGSVDYESLRAIGKPFTELLIEANKLKTAMDHISGILREQVNGILRPSFNLHLTDTYRSSSDSPNFQNKPIRDPVQGKLVRTAFIPREGKGIKEEDYSGIEVKGAFCYHQDPVMFEYLTTPGKDMHRDMAAQIYFLESAPAAWWKDKTYGAGKDVRTAGKSGFVFPQFYGSYFVECAKNLWNMLDSMNLMGPDGAPLKEWLKKHGIRSYTAFEKHLRGVENDFWNRRFKVYNKWKKKWYADYEKKGYFDTLTGFRCSGVMRRNQVVNYPIQGSSFHCLLWSFIEITDIMLKKKWKTRLIGQIHDSILDEYEPSEFNMVNRVMERVMTKDIREAWDWIIIPLEIEVEAAPVDESWHSKKLIVPFECGCGSNFAHKIDGGHYCPLCKQTNRLRV